jgi:hypothetical protein
MGGEDADHVLIRCVPEDRFLFSSRYGTRLLLGRSIFGRAVLSRDARVRGPSPGRSLPPGLEDWKLVAAGLRVMQRSSAVCTVARITA